MTNELSLSGCRPEPLGSYLKALGVLKLVAMQADPTAMGHWHGDTFTLGTVLSWDDLIGFFLEKYQPTPVVSPWNSSSGFGKEGSDGLGVIERSTERRFASYRRTIAVARRLIVEKEAGEWDKVTMVAACRSELPDDAIGWIDAAVVLTPDGAEFPPLLGSGGNDGRLEFSRNFHQRLIDVLGLGVGRRRKPIELRRCWLEDALRGTARAAVLRGKSPGQFDPGAAGGSNSSPLGAGENLLNPWDFVLLLEGSMLFASGASRRLTAGVSGKAAMPFMVSASNVGFSSAASEKTRGELWAPLWTSPAGFGEIAHLFAEGRVEWRGKRAASGLDVVKAAASLGVDRGIRSFARHVFAERFGLNTVAVPAGRLRVRARSEVAPVSQLDPWLERVRRASEPPASVTRALRLVDQAVFELARYGGAFRIWAVLSAAAVLELAVARSTAFRTRATNRLRPIDGLSARSWVPQLLEDGASPEQRLALALASCRDTDGGRVVRSVRFLLRPVASIERRLQFTSNERVPGLTARDTLEVLAAAHVRRSLDFSSRDASAAESDVVGMGTRFQYGKSAPFADIVQLAQGQIDGAIFARALAGTMLLDWLSPWDGQLRSPAYPATEPSLSVLGPFFARPSAQRPQLVPEESWPTQLANGRTADVLDAAMRRLRIAKLKPSPIEAHVMASTAPSGAQLAAALLCPIGAHDGDRLLHAIAPPDPEMANTNEEDPSAQP